MFIAGFTPNLTIENILSGKVDEPGPDTKKVATKSSKDKVTAIKNPETIPGNNAGITTLNKVCISVAPRS